MPKTTLVFFQDSNGDAPVVRWLEELRQKDLKGWSNCIAKLKLLAAEGYALRMPTADSLRDGIYELRAKHRKIQYRILYFLMDKILRYLRMQ